MFFGAIIGAYIAYGYGYAFGGRFETRHSKVGD